MGSSQEALLTFVEQCAHDIGRLLHMAKPGGRGMCTMLSMQGHDTPSPKAHVVKYIRTPDCVTATKWMFADSLRQVRPVHASANTKTRVTWTGVNTQRDYLDYNRLCEQRRVVDDRLMRDDGDLRQRLAVSTQIEHLHTALF